MKRILAVILSFILLLSGCSGITGADPKTTDIPTSPSSVITTSARGDIGELRSSPTIVNSDGTEFRLGMTRREFEELSGRTLENEWQTLYPDDGVTALSFDHIIVALSPGKGWTVSNGVELGMHVDRV